VIQTVVILLALALCGGTESSSPGHLDKGKALLSAKKYKEAAAEFEQVLKTDPMNTAALFNLGDIYANYLRDAKLRDRYWNRYKAASLISLGDVASEGREYQEAIARYHDAMKLMPGYGGLHERLGATYLLMGKRMEALKEYMAAADLDRDNAQLQLDVARHLAEHGYMTRAAVYADRAVAARPGDAELERKARAVLLGRGAATPTPETVSAEEHCARGERALKEGRLGEAAREIGNGMSRATRERSARLGRQLAEAFARNGSTDEAIAVYGELLSSGVRDADVYNSLAILQQETGKLDDAVVTMRESVYLYPGVAELHNNLGALYALKGEHDRAVSEYGKAVEIKPDLAEAYLDIGIIYKDYLKNRKKAIEAFRRYVALMPEGKNVPEVAELLGGGTLGAGAVPGKGAEPPDLIGSDERIPKQRRVLKKIER
jgi:pentatricopeptide repeat protein